MAPVDRLARLARLDALGAHVAGQEEALLSEHAEHERLRAAIASHTARPSIRVGAAKHGLLGFAAALVMIVAAILFVRQVRPSGLRFFVGASLVPGEVGRFMSAPDGAPLPIAFSDGTKVALEPGGRGRVVSVSPFGADLLVEEGRATIAVVPRPGNRWEVSTGPFVVHVTGTRFDVEWHPERDRFVLELYEGHVHISGCVLGDDHAINAGERVEASCKRGEFRVSRLVPGEKDVVGRVSVAPEASKDVTTAPVASAAGAAERAVPERSAGTSANTNTALVVPSWIDKARQGRFTAAYAAAVLVFEDVCGAGTAHDVLLLGDSARLSGHLVEAGRAYQSVRSRFAGSSEAALAAFELGRQDFDQRRDYPGAARWLRTYLDEEPRGALASSAMGRLMEAWVHEGRLDRARDVAGRYLARYQAGPYAETARRVLGTSGATPPR